MYILISNPAGIKSSGVFWSLETLFIHHSLRKKNDSERMKERKGGRERERDLARKIGQAVLLLVLADLLLAFMISF